MTNRDPPGADIKADDCRKLRRTSPEVILAHLCAVLCGIAITWASAGIGLMTLMTHTCIGAFDCPGPKLRTARQRVGEVGQGVRQSMIEAQRCPTSSELRASRNVPERSLVDAWGKAIVFSCAGEKIKATSAGRDGIFGTADDVTDQW